MPKMGIERGARGLSARQRKSIPQKLVISPKQSSIRAAKGKEKETKITQQAEEEEREMREKESKRIRKPTAKALYFASNKTTVSPASHVVTVEGSAAMMGTAAMPRKNTGIDAVVRAKIDKSSRHQPARPDKASVKLSALNDKKEEEKTVNEVTVNIDTPLKRNRRRPKKYCFTDEESNVEDNEGGSGEARVETGVPQKTKKRKPWKKLVSDKGRTKKGAEEKGTERATAETELPLRRKRGRPKKSTVREQEREADEETDGSKRRRNPKSSKEESEIQVEEGEEMIKQEGEEEEGSDGTTRRSPGKMSESSYDSLSHHAAGRSRRERGRGKMEEPVACDVCGQDFPSKAKLHRHKGTHEVSKLECQHCERLFKSRTHLIYHLRKTHTLEKLFACDVESCNKSYPIASLLENHKKVHGPRALVCEVCHKAFKLPSVLKAHRKTHEANRVPSHTCGECGIVVLTAAILRTHIKMQHTQRDKFRCNVCDKQYSYAYDLKVRCRSFSLLIHYLNGEKT
jgi:hypothetical protein